MIQGYFGGQPGRLRPYIIARVTIPALAINGTVHFLVDTGADSTLIAPRDAEELALQTVQLPEGPPSTGVGGRTPTRSTEATLTLDALTFTIPLRILAPHRPGPARGVRPVSRIGVPYDSGSTLSC